MLASKRLFPFVSDLVAHLNRDVSLTGLAAAYGRSPARFHRMFRQAMGETPKQYTQRLRLERAAARVATTGDSILDVALDAGFASHEVFTRAFTRYFGRSPSQYREAALRGAAANDRVRHAAAVAASGPCLRLFFLSPPSSRRVAMPVLSIERREIAPQPILLIRRRVAASELQPTLAECFGRLYGFAQREGLAIAGFPLCRYLSTGPGLWRIEPAVPLASPAAGRDDMEAGVLPGGPAAFAVHGGTYEGLPATNAAVERWIESSGFSVGGPPWEWYVTDPGQHPNPDDWRTEVYWPLTA